MLADIDYVGLAAVIGAIFTGLVSLVGAIAALRVNRKVNTGNGHTIGELATNVAAAVSTPPDAAPLGQIAAESADAIEAVHAAVNGATGEHPTAT